VKARLYFGHATNDQSMPAEAIEKFEWALRSRGGEYESEMYDARHGWMIPGGRVYDAENAERGFEKLMQLFDDTLQAAETRRASTSLSAICRSLNTEWGSGGRGFKSRRPD